MGHGMGRPQGQISSLVLIGLSWLMMVAALSVPILISGTDKAVLGDDAMRMVEAIDLFNGQAWTDTTQYRDNTPYGAPMHWSRLIDVPIVMLMAIFTPFLGKGAADAAAMAWPPLVLLGVIATLVALAERLVGPRGRIPVVVLAATALPVYSEFYPGRVDHHNVQALLALLAILSTIAARKSTPWAIAAGLVSATALAIGTESLPVIFANLAVVPLFWVIDPIGGRRPLLGFAASFGLATLLHLLAVTAPSAYFVPACDALSLTYVSAAGLYGLAVLIAVSLGARLKGPAMRFVVLLVLGALSGATALWLFPECLKGPYGNLDADLAAVLLTEIGEAQPLWVWMMGLRPALAILVLPFIGLGAVVAAAIFDSPSRRIDWLVLLAFSLALTLVMIAQVRGYRLAGMAGLPAAAWLISRAWTRFGSRKTVGAAALAAVTYLGFMGTVHWALATAFIPEKRSPRQAERSTAWQDCLDRDSFARLAALPPGRIMSYLIMGPQILLYTPHTIVTAGYHRNEAGLRDAIRFFSGDAQAARSVAEERGLDYLVFCRGIPAEEGLYGMPPFRGTEWPWLTALSGPDEPIQIYAIAPAAP